MTDEKSAAVELGPAADELWQALADVESALERSTINGDAELRREVYLRLLDQRLASLAKDETNGAAQRLDGPIDREFATEQQRAAAVARILDVPVEQIDKLYDLGMPNPALRLPSGRVPEQNADAVRAIALLYCAAKAALRQEAGTAEIKRTVERYGKLDGNFYTHLNDLPGLEVRGKPHSPNRKVQILFGGLERATAIARGMLQ